MSVKAKTEITNLGLPKISVRVLMEFDLFLMDYGIFLHLILNTKPWSETAAQGHLNLLRMTLY